MRLRIKQARPTDLNDAVRHAVELQAFQSSDKKIQESQGFVRALENDGATFSKSKIGKVLKEITGTLASLQKEVKSIKDSQKQSLRSTASNNQEGQLKSKPPKCYHCGKLGHYKSKCRYHLATKDGQNESQFQKKSVAGGFKKCKNSRDGNVAHLSCGTSEILNKAGESGMFVDVKIRDNVLEFLVDTGATVTLVSKSPIGKIARAYHTS